MTGYEFKHGARKFISTIRILFNLGMARTFGRYEYSTGNPDGFDYARYVWRGKSWAIPTTAIQPYDLD